ncbi:flagellum-specific peptidoglycan hydrolase FlgJ [Flavobacterium tiangeerense]|uniref:Peptidoglycan hydrolase n=1 Tax=Flavobacterium tiangeerense TaxID=459471 RepID=A0ABY3FNX7_9FLAO|nr:glucosaminidase domain-containing protein [Flavobacterium tiangeerense]TWI03371.1 flagellum-specific peptidoglycan hydrolase FlgJ [Flavobacterium tiangeerense]
MFKKYIVLLVVLVLASCNTTKPVIVTKKNTPRASVPTVVKGKPETYKPAKKTVAKVPTKPSVAVSQKSKATVHNVPKEVIVSTSKTVVTSDVIVLYVSKFKDIAMGNMRNYGIPASIILAQGILESGAGNGDLALSANNHFGIKCHIGWTGESVNHDDDASQECFRKYENPSESFKDHALFLTSRNRYAKLFENQKGDYKAWAKGLRAAGYATDPKYPDKLISYIERYNLHQYDDLVLGINSNIKIKEITDELNISNKNSVAWNSDSYEVQKGDTLYSIAKKFALQVEDLKQKNNLTDNALAIGQRLIVK